jgi:hypothetical protein
LAAATIRYTRSTRKIIPSQARTKRKGSKKKKIKAKWTNPGFPPIDRAGEFTG